MRKIQMSALAAIALVLPVMTGCSQGQTKESSGGGETKPMKVEGPFLQPTGEYSGASEIISVPGGKGYAFSGIYFTTMPSAADLKKACSSGMVKRVICLVSDDVLSAYGRQDDYNMVDKIMGEGSYLPMPLDGGGLEDVDPEVLFDLMMDDARVVMRVDLNKPTLVYGGESIDFAAAVMAIHMVLDQGFSIAEGLAAYDASGAVDSYTRDLARKYMFLRGAK